MTAFVRRAAPPAAALLAYAAAVPWVFRPWFLGEDLLPHVPPPLGALVDADLYLNIWILTWIAHAVLVDIWSVLDGNIFHPAARTIVGSENMIAHVPFTAPVLAYTGSALAVLKAYVLESFALTGLGMFLYVRHHTQNTWAALVAGAAFTFTPFRADTVPQPQYLGMTFVPLALLSVDLYLETSRRRWLGAFAASLALQALSCVYIGFFVFVLCPVYVLVRTIQRATTLVGWIKPTATLAFTMLVAAVALIPAALPYLQGRDEGSIPDYDLMFIHIAGWAPWRYVSSEFIWRAGIVAVGVVGLDLVVSLVRRWRAQDRPPLDWQAPPVALWAVMAVGATLAIGPYLPLPGNVLIPMPYVALYDFVPGFSSIRVPTRFVIMVAAGLAALSGFAFDRAFRDRGSRVSAAAAVGLLCLAVLGASPRPQTVMAANLVGPKAEVYRWLAARPGPGAVLEIPAQTSEQDTIGNWRNGKYMVASSIHWRPLLNGYTAYPPSSAGFYAAAIRDLPRPEALQLLIETTDLRWVIVHRDELSPEEAEPWRNAPPGLEPVAQFGASEVYTITASRTRDWRDEVDAHMRGVATQTFEGAALSILPEACRRGAITDVALPDRIGPIPLPRRIPVQIRNDSDCVWPATGLLGHHVVGLHYRWIPPDGVPEEFQAPVPFFQLLRDVPATSQTDGAIMLTPPRGPPGLWTLEVQLVQQSTDEPIATFTGLVDVRARRVPKT